jgi:hypothetical protein
MEVAPLTDQLRISKLVGGVTGGVGAGSLPQLVKLKMNKIAKLNHFIIH